MNVRQIPAPTVAEMLANGEALTIIDVRTSEEYAEAHVPGSHHIPLQSLPGAVASLPRDRTLYMFCRSGSRSDFAGKWLAEQGFNVVNVAGGILNWDGPLETAQEDD